MFSLVRAKSVLFGLSLLLLAVMIACGEAATPVPTAAPPPPQPTPDIAALVSGAVTQALDAQEPTGLTAQEIQHIVSGSIAATLVPGASAADVQAAVTAAVGAIEPGVSAADVQEHILRALTALAAAATPVPTAAPAPAPAPAPAVPTGTLDVGVTGLGPVAYAFWEQGANQFKFDGLVTHEYLWDTSPDTGEAVGRLIDTWGVDIAADGSAVYSIKLKEGIQWQRGWGEFTSADVLYTFNNAIRAGTTHAAARNLRPIWFCDDCDLKAVDRYNITLSRPEINLQFTFCCQGPRTASAVTLHSELHFQTDGEDGVRKTSVGTGPWVITDAETGSFRKAAAVQDHWHKTPEWAEIVWWDISEDSTRLANYLVGRLDTGTFNSQDVQAIKNEKREADKYLVIGGGLQQYLFITGGQHYLDHPNHTGDDPKVPVGENALDCTLEWVPCNRDRDSDDWKKARDVRTALSLAIDRQAMVNNLAFGAGVPSYLGWMTGREPQVKEYGLDKLVRDFDPAQARTLLAGAGLSGGFTLPATIYQAFNPGNIEAFMAAIANWEDIGVKTEITNTTYGTVRPTLVNRTAKGMWSFSDSHTFSPIAAYGLFYSANSALNFGFEHPDLQALIDAANKVTKIDDLRSYEADIARFLYEEGIQMSLYTANLEWPMGPALDTWTVQPYGVTWLNNWEDAPHRQ
jgi:ABC-type transport system substrate-binding protein